MALDQTNRYSDLSLKEEDLVANGKHILVAYTMVPAEGYGYLSTAAHFAAESSTGTNVEVSTTDDFTKGVDALVYEIDEAKGIMKIAYPNELFDRNVIDGRAMIVSFLTLAIGNNQAMGDVKCAQMQDFFVPPEMLVLFDGPSKDISDMWRILAVLLKMVVILPVRLSNLNWVCVLSHLQARPTNFGWVVISLRMTNLKVTRFSAQ